MNALFSDFCFPFLRFQVGRVAFDGINYYIVIFDTLYSPKTVSAFFERPLCLYFTAKTPKAAEFYRDNLKSF